MSLKNVPSKLFQEKEAQEQVLETDIIMIAFFIICIH